MASQEIRERTAIAFTKLPQAGKDYIEGYMRGLLMAYEHMNEKETQQPEKQSA